MRRTLIAVVVLIAAVAAVGCSRAGEESEAKRAPKTPPPPAVEVPDDLQIAVTIDGRDAPPLTAARLRAVEPDFHDAERRAWRIVHLVPEADRAEVDYTLPDGSATDFVENLRLQGGFGNIDGSGNGLDNAIELVVPR